MPRLALPFLVVLALAACAAPASAAFHLRLATATWVAGDAAGVHLGGLERVQGTSSDATGARLVVETGSCARGDRTTTRFEAVLPLLIDPSATTARVSGTAQATGEERPCDGTASRTLPPVAVVADLTWRPAGQPIARAYGPLPGFGCTGAAVLLAHHGAAVHGTAGGVVAGVDLGGLGAPASAFLGSTTSAGAC